MDNFVDALWTNPSRPRHYFPTEVPVHRKTTPARKVISIPVRSVMSERSRSDAAVKIQKVLRGFLVRTSVKKIAEIRCEVDDMEKRILDEEIVSLIRRDSKERLKVNEMLMSLLFRLDSIRGVDCGVRDCRRAVIKKAIRLQEMVDAIVPPDPDPVSDVAPEIEGNAANSGSNFNHKENENGVDETVELRNHDESLTASGFVSIDNVNKTEEMHEEIDETTQLTEKHKMEEISGEIDETVNLTEKEHPKEGNAQVSEIGEDANVEERLSESEEESQADSSANPQSFIEGDEEEEEGGSSAGDEKDVGDVKGQCDGEKGVGNRRSRELLEKMVEDNEKMMGLMAELFERNEMQTRLLSSLSQRVEHLERALMCERERARRKQKKRNAAAGLVDCLESTHDNKKCGKR